MYATADGTLIDALPAALADAADDVLADAGLFHVRESVPPGFDPASQALTVDGGVWGFDVGGPWPVVTLAWAVRPLTEAERVAQARARQPALLRRLQEIDTASIRPARAIAATLGQGGTPDPADVATLAALESEAQALRADLGPDPPLR
ncbi:hypothetical protein [Pararhodospirillum photometricum]|uniref:Uncharacterized protein n=1 Tax=Pararhodospirillum photometricum DSM 122 TaxID=1150469 RepID=H6SKA1_PARPM|nr:hypothetical protein [Pararhodospirillum photometricum]CCG08416.1 unnamed protein product [Pararhodospirillum photometricum DSM 122]